MAHTFFFFFLLNQVSTFHVSTEGLFLNSLFFMLQSLRFENIATGHLLNFLN